MDYQALHREILKIAPRNKNLMIDRMTPVDNGGSNLGIRVPVVKKFVSNFHQKEKPTFKEAVFLADECFKQKITEEIIFAIELTAKYKEARDVKFWNHATGWIKYLTNWENCDRLCGVILGKILLQNPELAVELEKWSKDKFYWRRRCAIVSFIVPLAFEGKNKLYGQSKFIKSCLGICARLGNDPNLYTQKAVGWPIREITKWGGRDLTFNWLVKNKNKLSGFVFHASLEKFSPKDKSSLKAL